MARKGLHIERKVGMYDTCQGITAYHDLTEFGGATYDPIAKTWIISLRDRNNTISDFDVQSDGDHEASMQHVEALISLFYRQNYSTIHKVRASNLIKGDLVGSGETIVNVATGLRTPRGKVEVTLEKNGNRRLAIWGASTVINVRRAACDCTVEDVTAELLAEAEREMEAV